MVVTACIAKSPEDGFGEAPDCGTIVSEIDASSMIRRVFRNMSELPNRKLTQKGE